MKIIQNVFSFLIALVLVVLTITFSLYSFGVLSASFLPDFIASAHNSWQLGLVSLIILAMALLVIYPYFIDQKFKSTKLLSSESGDISITISALSNLIKDRIKEKEKIDNIKVKLKEVEAGLVIILKGDLTVPGDLPMISENIQRDLKTYIEETTGIQVEKVQFRINNVKKAENLSGEVK